MRDAEISEFTKLLDSVSSLLSRGAYVPNAQNSLLFFRAVQAHELSTVRAAFTAHARDPMRGRFVPVPADIVAQIEALAGDGRPGVEEAWAMVPMGEDQTVVWTTEMAEAYGACTALLASGDRIGARMAFKEVYERAVSQAKREGQRPVWQASLGSDLDKRKRALTAAIEAGRMTEEGAHAACPALPMPKAQRLLLPPDTQRRDQFKARISALAEAKRGDAVEPLAWARRLQAREEAGEDLSVTQRNAWRNALGAPAQQTIGGFSPIDSAALPPAMRRGADHGQDPRP